MFMDNLKEFKQPVGETKMDTKCPPNAQDSQMLRYPLQSFLEEDQRAERPAVQGQALAPPSRGV